jgi:hypothetical protein
MHKYAFASSSAAANMIHMQGSTSTPCQEACQPSQQPDSMPCTPHLAPSKTRCLQLRKHGHHPKVVVVQQ